MISGRSRLTTYERTLKRKPGKTSCVNVAPPSIVAPFEDERAQAAPGEVGGADEAVVAATDDDRVVAR